MKVELLNYTPDGERLIAQAGKLCYSPASIQELREKLTEEEIESFINKLIELGHESPLEHISFTFGIEGVSRSLTHQLVRHRIASYSQKSQRYVKENQFEYIIPPAIKENEEAKDLYIKTMKDIQKSYDKLTELLKEDGRTEKKAIEDARYILPNGTETKIIVTMNARSLLHFFKLRTCNRAQWEIRQLAKEMLRQVKKVYPSLFKTAGPSCITGPCPEGKMTCGKIEEVRKEFSSEKDLKIKRDKLYLKLEELEKDHRIYTKIAAQQDKKTKDYVKWNSYRLKTKKDIEDTKRKIKEINNKILFNKGDVTDE